MNQWLPNREPKVSSDVLQALSHMYPLLPPDTIIEQATKVIQKILGFYRRQMDRNAITQLLASVLKTTIDASGNCLDTISDLIIGNLFDLVCVQPDYERPQTVKGHYEVLRCFDLMVTCYSTKIFEMLLVQMRSNNERERIKSLLVLTHLTNTVDGLIRQKIADFLSLLKQMVNLEKTCKLKMVILKTIVALAQKNLVTDADFIKFILRNCCALQKFNQDYGTAEEQADLIEACQNSLYILCSTVVSMDEIIKYELLQAYMQLDHTTVCHAIAKCLAKVYARKFDGATTPIADAIPITVKDPSPEAIFVRSLILMGNVDETQRTENILLFLKYYAPVVHKHLRPMWLERIPIDLIPVVGNKEEFLPKLYQFLQATIKDVDDFKFAESLVNKCANQLVLYPQFPLPIASTSDYVIPKIMQQERGMLLKVIGICLCYVTDTQTIESMVDFIMTTVRQERLDKNTPNMEYEQRFYPASEALGFASRIHYELVLARVTHLVKGEGKTKTGNTFFGSLMKDSAKELEIYKINILTIRTYECIVQTVAADVVLKDIDKKMVTYLSKQLEQKKDFTMKKLILNTLLTIAQKIRENNDSGHRLHMRNILLNQLINIESSFENLPLFPTILKLASALIQQNIFTSVQGTNTNVDDAYHQEVYAFFEESCRKFFTTAQQLKSDFESIAEDEHNSILAQYLNLSLPELNCLVRAIFEQSPSPATLDDVNGVLENWIKNPNPEVRICAGHVMNDALYVSNP